MRKKFYVNFKKVNGQVSYNRNTFFFIELFQTCIEIVLNYCISDLLDESDD